MQLIDLLHLGRRRVIGAWLVDDVIIDPGPASCLPALLDALGERRPRALLLTHIHLDHAGAAGTLVERWPELEVYVHGRGAPHLVDPAKLLASATRLYGEDMQRLWGEVQPVPEAAIRTVAGGEEIIDRRFTVAYTPGHASHHVAFRHGETAFVGDVAGVRIVDGGPTIPPTPPPDIDVEAWHASVALVREWRPRRLAMTHFGAAEDVEAQLDELELRLDRWADIVAGSGQEAFEAELEATVSDGAVGADALAAYRQAAPWDQLFLGLERFARKRSGR